VSAGKKENKVCWTSINNKKKQAFLAAHFIRSTARIRQDISAA